MLRTPMTRAAMILAHWPAARAVFVVSTGCACSGSDHTTTRNGALRPRGWGWTGGGGGDQKSEPTPFALLAKACRVDHFEDPIPPPPPKLCAPTNIRSPKTVAFGRTGWAGGAEGRGGGPAGH